MLNRVTVRDDGVVAALVVVGLVAALAVAGLLTVALVGDTGSETYFRITAIVAVIGTLSTVLIPVARALRRAV